MIARKHQGRQQKTYAGCPEPCMSPSSSSSGKRNLRRGGAAVCVKWRRSAGAVSASRRRRFALRWCWSKKGLHCSPHPKPPRSAVRLSPLRPPLRPGCAACAAFISAHQLSPSCRAAACWVPSSCQHPRPRSRTDGCTAASSWRGQSPSSSSHPSRPSVSDHAPCPHERANRGPCPAMRREPQQAKPSEAWGSQADVACQAPEGIEAFRATRTMAGVGWRSQFTKRGSARVSLISGLWRAVTVP